MKFTVEGIPVPQGSMSAFVPKHSKTGRPIITSANPRLKLWRQTVRSEAIKIMGAAHPAGRNVAVRVQAVFFLPRAKSNKAMDCTKKPDVDKLLRALLDALTNVVYEDDSQVVEVHCFKTYGRPRVEIEIGEVGIVPTLLEYKELNLADTPF